MKDKKQEKVTAGEEKIREEEKKDTRNDRALSDDDLDQVSGGGGFQRIRKPLNM